MNMKKTLVLFITVVVVSMAVMLVFFSLFFDQLSLKFNTRNPDTAPLVTDRQEASPFAPRTTNGFDEADVNVPSESTAKPMAPFMGVDGQHPEPAVVDSSLTPTSPTEAPAEGVNPLATEAPPPDAAALATPPAPPSPTASTPKLYRVYVAGFATEDEAKQALPRYQAQGASPVVKRHKGGVVIQLGVFNSLEAARAMADATGAAVDPL
jgi:hypothetical protein